MNDIITYLRDHVDVVVAILALIISIISYFLSIRTAISDIRPVLVFIYDSNGWSIKNVGKGPALNILIAQKKIAGEWFNPVRIPPLSVDSEFLMEWLGHVDDTGLGANYNDFEGREYSATCGNDLSKVFKGSTLPTWCEKEIRRYWKYPYKQEFD